MDPRYDGDPDREEFEALIALRAEGVDVTDAIGDIHDRRAARDAPFESLVAPLREPAGVQAVVWTVAEGDEARSERLRAAKPWKLLGRDTITGTVRWRRPDGVEELRYPDGTVDRFD